MEFDLEDVLSKKYSKLTIQVEYYDIREYKIFVYVLLAGEELKIVFNYKYDAYLTLRGNTEIIENIIDNKILDLIKS